MSEEEDPSQYDARRLPPAAGQSLAVVRFTSELGPEFKGVKELFPGVENANAKFAFLTEKTMKKISILQKGTRDTRMEAAQMAREPTMDIAADWDEAEVTEELQLISSIDGKKANAINEVHQKVTQELRDGRPKKRSIWSPWRKS